MTGTRVRRWGVPAVAVLAAVALAGCGKPAGVDGDLVNGWPQFPDAKTPVPVAGSCYTEEYSATWYGDFDPVSCATTHVTESAYVGTFTDADASRATPPTAGSNARKTAYKTCVSKANDYLGGDWHTAYAWLGMVLPSPAAWTGGARWFRCDLMKTDDAEYHVVNSDSSLKDGLLGEKPLAITCINTTEDSKGNVQGESAASCASPHTAELAGVSEGADTAWPGDTAIQDKADTACQAVVAKYLGFTDGRDQNPVVGWLFFWPRQEQWDSGDHTFTCFAYAFTKSGKMTGSVKGLRTKAPKG